MTETAHTPAPWGFDPESGEIFHDDGNIRPLIATVDCESASEQQALADMRLMTAAPDLLDALAPFADKARHHAADAPEWRDSDAVSAVISIGDLRRAAAAIARATGEKETVL